MYILEADESYVILLYTPELPKIMLQITISNELKLVNISYVEILCIA